MQVLITVSFVPKLTGSTVLTQLRIVPKKYRLSVPIPSGLVGCISLKKTEYYESKYCQALLCLKHSVTIK